MANYIQTLQARVAELTAELAARDAAETEQADRFNQFHAHLQCSKFQGHEEDGTLRSTIQVGDVHRWLDVIQRGN